MGKFHLYIDPVKKIARRESLAIDKDVQYLECQTIIRAPYIGHDQAPPFGHLKNPAHS